MSRHGSPNWIGSRTCRSGQVRAVLEKAGTTIGAYNVLIAGQALRRGLTVVTASTAEFSRVTGLNWEDWTR
jgi:tRNA(fMet)-specific endonuclease VapC